MPKNNNNTVVLQSGERPDLPEVKASSQSALVI